MEGGKREGEEGGGRGGGERREGRGGRGEEGGWRREGEEGGGRKEEGVSSSCPFTTGTGDCYVMQHLNWILSQGYMHALPCNVSGWRNLTCAMRRWGLGHLYQSRGTEQTSLLPRQHSEEGM